MNLVNGRAFQAVALGFDRTSIVRIQKPDNSSRAFHLLVCFEVAPKLHLKPGDFLISLVRHAGTSFGAFIFLGGAARILEPAHLSAELFGGIYNRSSCV